MFLCLSFDDGRNDCLNAFQILKKYGLVASFHITTGFIDGTYFNASFKKPLTLENLAAFKANGMDICSHGDKHICDKSDYLVSFNKLTEWKLIDNECGFSVPNSEFSELQLELISNCNQNSYIRIGRNKKCYTFSSKIYYIIYKIFRLNYFYKLFNRYNVEFLDDLNIKRIHSVVIKSYVKPKHLISFLEEYKNLPVVIVLLFHSITDFVSNEWDYYTDNFDKLCSYLSSSQDIECVTLSNLDKNIRVKKNEF